MGGGPKVVRALGAVLDHLPTLEDKLRSKLEMSLKDHPVVLPDKEGVEMIVPQEVQREADALMVYLMSVERDPISAGLSEDDFLRNPFVLCSKPIQDMAGPAGDEEEMMAIAQSRPAYRFAVDQALEAIDLARRELEVQPSGGDGEDVVEPVDPEDNGDGSPAVPKGDHALDEIDTVKDLISKLVDAQMQVASAAKTVSERYAEIGRLRMLELISRLSSAQLEAFGRTASNIPYTGDATAINRLASALVNVLGMTTAEDLVQSYLTQMDASSL
jgi:hypothetical protein